MTKPKEYGLAGGEGKVFSAMFEEFFFFSVTVIALSCVIWNIWPFGVIQMEQNRNNKPQITARAHFIFTTPTRSKETTANEDKKEEHRGKKQTMSKREICYLERGC